MLQRKRLQKIKRYWVFLMNKKLKNNVKEFNRISDRVACVIIKLSNKYYLKVIQVYAHTATSTQKTLDKFYDDINEATGNTKTHYLIVMGDFTAKIGLQNEECLEKFSHGKRNERG